MQKLFLNAQKKQLIKNHSKHKEAWTEYSDAYKDINGFRPTGLKIIHDIFFNGTVKEYLQELDNIWNEYNVMMKKELNRKEQ